MCLATIRAIRSVRLPGLNQHNPIGFDGNSAFASPEENTVNTGTNTKTVQRPAINIRVFL